MSDIKALVERLDGLYGKATKGEWKFVAGGRVNKTRIENDGGTLLDDDGDHVLGDADLALIAALVNAWPDLRHALSSLSVDAEKWRDQQRMLRSNGHDVDEYYKDAALSAGDEREGE